MKYPKGDGKTKRILRGGVPYQSDRLIGALPFMRERRFALDVGAHVGMWTVQLACLFDAVCAVEPHDASFDSLLENVEGMPNVSIWHGALGAKIGTARLIGSGLGSHIVEAGEGGGVEVSVDTIDSMGLHDLDFLKIDAEGFEPFIVRGGEATIRRDRPVIVIEQKHGRHGFDKCAAVSILKSWGAVVEWKMKHDYCLRWK